MRLELQKPIAVMASLPNAYIGETQWLFRSVGGRDYKPQVIRQVFNSKTSSSLSKFEGF
jgi:hypothetical protein